MSEPAPPGVTPDALGRDPEALTPEAVENVLADFRSWLTHARQQAVAPADEPSESVTLHTLVGQFLALRHEVHLQTKAARAQQEQAADALRQLGQAVEALRQPRPATQEAGPERLRPLLKALVDAADLLGLARREVQRVAEAAELDAQATPEAVAAPRPSFWGRWFGGRSAAAERDRARQEAARLRESVRSVLAGYTMSVQRLERALQQVGLEPLACVGRPFDPETMEAVEAAGGTGRPAGEVLEEVRRGWAWQGRVFRCAQVRVAKS